MIKTSVMTVAGISTVKDQELISDVLVESSNVNSFADFITSKFDEQEVIVEKENNDLINNFIYYLIFYGIFVISLLLHVSFDLGLSSFLRKIFIQLIVVVKNNLVDKNLLFA